MDPVVFAFGPVARHPGRTAAAARLAVLLAEAVGRRVVHEVCPSYDELLDSVAERRPRFAWLPPAVYVRAVDDHDVALVVGGERAHSMQFRGSLFVKRERPWRTPEDLRGLRVAWVDPISCAGYLFPRLSLIDRGIDPDRFFAAQHMLGDHASVARAVALGTADVGATFVAEEHRQPEEPQLRAGWAMEVDPAIMRGVLLTEPIPSDTICASSSVDPDLLARVSAALCSLHESETGRDVLGTLFGVERLLPVDPDGYASVRRALASATRT